MYDKSVTEYYKPSGEQNRGDDESLGQATA